MRGDESSDDGTEDRSAICRFQGGETQAFDELMQRHQRRAYAFAYHLTKGHDEAGDVVADTFLRVYRSLNRFRGDSSFSSWLYRIELNCFLDIRKRARYRSVLNLDEALGGHDGLVVMNNADDRQTPHDHLERRERHSAIEKAVKRLCPEQREAFTMFQIEEMSYVDIAKVLEIPIGTIKSRLHRARFQLRRSLVPHDSRVHA